MDEPFAGRLSQLLEITVQLQESVDELRRSLAKQLEHALKSEIVPAKAHRRRRAKRK